MGASRVRFNITLILAAVVTLLGVIEIVFGINPINALCSPPREPAAVTPAQQGGQPAGGAETPAESGGNGSAWLLMIVGLGVGAYSWLTSPRQYRVYPGCPGYYVRYAAPAYHPLQRHQGSSQRPRLYGRPLRVYTMNRRRIPLQVPDPDPMHQALQSALAEFRRIYPQYAPPPAEEPEGAPTPPEAADATATGAAPETAPPPASESPGDSPTPDAAPPPPPRNRSSRRRSLRDDTYDGESDDSRPRFS